MYQNSYHASIDIIKKIIPFLPKEEKYDLCDQMRRSCKAIPRLIAEGYAERQQRKGFQRYLIDSMGESNEMIVSLSHCRDIYYNYIDAKLSNKLIDIYDKIGRQLYNLSLVWTNFKEISSRTS